MTARIDYRSIAARMLRHERIAFQLSGGRDSVAALYAMSGWWDQMTVYHLDTGDRFPEVARVIERIQSDVPVTIVQSSAQAFRTAHGMPADIVPADNEPAGQFLSANPVGLVSRFVCCAHVIMVPMHQRMLDDGITLIVRGQRASDYVREPAPQGVDIGGMELLFPIHDWSDQDVDAFIEDQGLPVGDFYAAGMSTTPDCMGCTAWLGDGRLAYMADRFPAQAADVRARIQTIRAEVARQLKTFEVHP